MTDEADDAEVLQEQEIARRLADARAALAHPEAEATGECLWCGRDVASPRRWCDAECCRQYERNVLRRKA